GMGKCLLFAIALVLVACAEPREPADTMFAGGRIVPVASASDPEALIVTGERIVAVGKREDLLKRFDPKATVDLTGHFMLPGFVDAHVHPIHGGMNLGQCELSDAATIADIEAAVKACAAKGAPDQWLIGAGWNLSLFPSANPQASMLDSWVSDRPVFLRGADGHSAWTNSKSLAAAAIDAKTVPPPNGVIERDATGAPTGTLRESAMGLVAAVLPPVSDAERDAALERALAVIGENGITTVIEAAASEEDLATYQRAATAGALTVRVNASLLPKDGA